MLANLLETSAGLRRGGQGCQRVGHGGKVDAPRPQEDGRFDVLGPNGVCLGEQLSPGVHQLPQIALDARQIGDASTAGPICPATTVKNVKPEELQ